MARSNSWNPLRQNNPLAGGNPERNWLTREHRDIPQPNQENTHRPVDPLRRQSTGDSGRERLAQIAEKFVRKAAALVTLGQIPVTDQMLFHDWLHPNGKLDLNRARSLAMQEQYYYQQYYPESGTRRIEEVEDAELHFLKSFLENLFKIGDGVGEHKHKHNRNRKRNEEEALEAYEAGKQAGEEEAYCRDQYYRTSYYRDKCYRDSYYRNKDKLENDPNNDPLG